MHLYPTWASIPIACLALSLLLLSSVGFAEAPAKAKLCIACHGEKGAAPILNSYPKLNGQNKDYLVAALKDYKNGKRTGSMSAVMTAQTASLSEADIEALAEYFAIQN